MKKILNNIIIITIIIMIISKILNNTIYNKLYNFLTYIGIIIVLISSIYLTIKLKFINLNIKKIFNNLKNNNKENIKALFISLGAKIGVGSLAGTSIAIYTAGPGVIFWIWIITILSSILTYCETYLGITYDNKGVFNYIKNGLNNKTLSIIYTVLLILIYEVGFVGIQSNTIYKSLKETIIIDNTLLIIIITTIITILLISNINTIINRISKIVPIMCLIYIFTTIPLLLNINITKTLILIIKEGLNKNKIKTIIVAGLQRGIFATESGTGTSSIASTISKNKKEQALFQVLGSHFITLIITITGIIIINNQNTYPVRINGIELLMDIYINYYGPLGKVILNIIITLFAVSTILSSYFFTQKGIEFLNYKTINNKIIILLFIVLGMLIESSLIWSIIDAIILLLLLINTFTILKLNKQIK